MKLKLCSIFQNFQNGRHFEVATIFWLKVVPKVEYASMIAMSIYDILSFWSTLWLKCWWRYCNFKPLPTLWPGDVIDDVMNTDLYKYSHNPVIPMYGKFNDDICVRFLVIMKYVLISFIKEYSAPTLRPPISNVKLNLCLIFKKFQNGRHFEVIRNFFTGSNTGSWIYHLSI